MLSALPQPLYDTLPYALAPLLGNPLNIAAFRTSLRGTGVSGVLRDPGRAVEALGELRDAMVELLPSMG